ncbi:hypothetical protein GF366_00260 [Candidatus Peregrinibacteria bacterium]|nr:hypothetical protein [Candidatus Peregrinibacteria bacterium]
MTSSETVDVKEIMKKIKSGAGQKDLEKDLRMLDSLCVLDEKVDEELLSAKVAFLKENCMLSDKFNFTNSHRKGLLGKIFTFFQIKLFVAMKIFMEKIIVTQETFNAEVAGSLEKMHNRFLSGDKKVLNLSGVSDEQILEILKNVYEIFEEGNFVILEISSLNDGLKAEIENIGFSNIETIGDDQGNCIVCKK